MTRFIALIVVVAFISPVVAQTDTTFTYQGQLKENSAPANGLYNMDFTLWDAISSGNQIGAEVSFNGHPVIDGRFTVELDFGANAFDNTDRWLEISVNGNELNPRTPITRSPYSIQTRGIFVDQDKNVGIGNSAPDGSLHVRQGSAGDVTAYPDSVAVLESDGFGYLSILTPDEFERGIFFGDPESNISGGITYNNPALPDGLQFRTAGNQNRMVIDEFGKIGIRTTNPISRLHVFGDTTVERDLWLLQNTNSSLFRQNGPNLFVSNHAAGNIILSTGTNNPVARITIWNDGRVGIAGDVDIGGTLSKCGGSFKIDHPLDPANKYLSHSFVESPDMMNIYNGNVTCDGAGRATITLPDWFDALNRQFRYQLTCIGGFAPVYVETEIENNQFTIAGGKAGLKVSWQVTGVRQDAWAEANRIPVEEPKVGFEAGHYLDPEVYDLDQSMSILAAREALRNATASEPERQMTDVRKENESQTYSKALTAEKKNDTN